LVHTLPSLGSRILISGDVTTLQWIIPSDPVQTCAALGYARWRLSQGFAVLLAIEKPSPQAFEFAGTTLRSGGREGKPQMSLEEDRARPSVHQKILDEYGEKGYKNLQIKALNNIELTGSQRLAKVIPVIKHSNLPPAIQYPMGGGGLQWKIKDKHPIQFLVAVHVTPNGDAVTPQFSVNVNNGGYDARAKLHQYLISAR